MNTCTHRTPNLSGASWHLELGLPRENPSEWQISGQADNAGNIQALCTRCQQLVTIPYRTVLQLKKVNPDFLVGLLKMLDSGDMGQWQAIAENAEKAVQAREREQEFIRADTAKGNRAVWLLKKELEERKANLYTWKGLFRLFWALLRKKPL